MGDTYNWIWLTLQFITAVIIYGMDVDFHAYLILMWIRNDSLS